MKRARIAWDGAIREAVDRAALLGAAEGLAPTMQHYLRAARLG